MRHALTFLALLALVPATVDAQPAPRVTAFDVAGSIGLFTADRSDGTDCCSSWSGSFFRGLSAGYYWNDHLKTEAEFAVPGPTVGYASSNRRLADGSWATILDERTYSGPMFSASQAYQFGRNAYIIRSSLPASTSTGSGSISSGRRSHAHSRSSAPRRARRRASALARSPAAASRRTCRNEHSSGER
jgi:hypothetical protein